MPLRLLGVVMASHRDAGQGTGNHTCASGHASTRLAVMSWVYLLIAGLLEIVWAVGLKFTAGFSRLGPSVLTVGAMIASFVFLGQALKTIPVGTGYAVWTGIGAVGVWWGLLAGLFTAAVLLTSRLWLLTR